MTQLKGSAIYLLWMRKFLEIHSVMGWFIDWSISQQSLLICQVVLGCVSLSVVWDSRVGGDWQLKFKNVHHLQSLLKWFYNKWSTGDTTERQRNLFTRNEKVSWDVIRWWVGSSIGKFINKFIYLPGGTWMCFPFSSMGLMCWWWLTAPILQKFVSFRVCRSDLKNVKCRHNWHNLCTWMWKFLAISFSDGLVQQLIKLSKKFNDLQGATWMCFNFSSTGLTCSWWLTAPI